MGKNRKYIAKIFHSLFGVVFVFAGVLLFGTSAKAAGDVTRYRTAYLQNLSLIHIFPVCGRQTRAVRKL